MRLVCLSDLLMPSAGLNFKLKAFKEWKQDPSIPQGGAYVKQIAYEPLALDKEQDRDFVESLGIFKEEFKFPRDQVHSFLCRMRDAMEATVAEA